MAVRNMLIPCGMSMLHNKGPACDRGPSSTVPLVEHKVVSRDGA